MFETFYLKIYIPFEKNLVNNTLLAELCQMTIYQMMKGFNSTVQTCITWNKSSMRQGNVRSAPAWLHVFSKNWVIFAITVNLSPKL